MDLQTFLSASDFLETARSALEANEAANNLMLGLALTAQRSPERFEIQPFFGVVLEQNRVQIASLMTPPHNLVVFSASRSDAAPAFGLLANQLCREGWPVPGVIGPSQAALEFAGVWQVLTGEASHLNIRERLYELRRVVSPPPTPGHMRPASSNDLELMARWMFEFNQEALPDEPLTLDEARKHVSNRIGEGTYYLWEDGQPVALTGHGRHTPHGCSIGPVYTPIEFRRRGYATALTAVLSQLLLDSGKQFITLFTNLANPTSNSIYMKIGYRPVCDFDLYRFVKPKRT
jgi:predicted GNAT family acetyltransferase